MQWTILSQDHIHPGSDVELWIKQGTYYEHTFPFSNPLGNKTTFTVELKGPSTPVYDQCYGAGIANIQCPESLDPPPTSLSSITTRYVVFYILDNNFSAPIAASFKGPQGPLNVTGYYPPNSIPLEPRGSTVSTFQYFETDQPGNYSASILTTRCDYPCATTNATGYIMMGQSSLTYDRPFYIGGLATVVVSGIGIALTVAFLALNAFRIIKQRWKHSEEQRGSPEPSNSPARN